MITKNYTADRTETPGDATSTIPAAMANYWINGVNSLISDLTPLKDAGGFYAPVGFNYFKPTTAQTITSTPSPIGLTKTFGSLTMDNAYIIRLPKGYMYEAQWLVPIRDGAYAYTDMLNEYGVNVGLATAFSSPSTFGSNYNDSIGYSLLDFTSASSDMFVQLSVTNKGGNVIIHAEVNSILWIKKYKLIPFTAAT